MATSNRPSLRLDPVKVRKILHEVDVSLVNTVQDLRNGYIYQGIDNNLAADTLDQVRQLISRVKHRLITDQAGT